MSTILKPRFNTPKTFAEALRLAADLLEKNEKLEQRLHELRVSSEYPEVLRPAHIERLCGVSKSVVAEWVRDPAFPVLNKNRKKGELVMVLKDDLYKWLKTAREIS